MADQIAVLRPAADVAATWTVVGGPATMWQATDDSPDDDGTYIDSGNSSTNAKVSFTPWTQPGYSTIRGVQPIVRAERALSLSAANGFTERLEDTLTGAQSPAWVQPAATSFDTYFGPVLASRPGGEAWTEDAVNGLRMWLARHTVHDGAHTHASELFLWVYYNVQPTVSVTAPSGALVGQRADVAWTVTDAEGDTPQGYRVVIVNDDEYLASGFDPDSAVGVWSVVNEASAADSVTGPNLANGTYRAYVQARDALGFGPWSFSAFTVDSAQGGAPTLTATADDDRARVALTGVAYANMLTESQADFELGPDAPVTDWAIGGATSEVTRTAGTSPLVGLRSLAMVADGVGGTMTARTAPTSGAGVAAVVPGRLYTGLLSVKSAATPRAVTALLQWRDGAGTLLGTSTGQPVTSATAGWTMATVGPVAAPAGAVYVTLSVSVAAAAAGEVHYVDCASVRPGAPNLLAVAAASVESDVTGLGWWNSGSGTVGRSTTVGLQGRASVTITSGGAGAATVAIKSNSAAAAVVEGETYCACAAFRGAAGLGDRLARVVVAWYDAASVQVGAGVNGADVTATDDGWTFATVQAGVAPAGAVKARVTARFVAAAAGEVMHVDCVAVMPGTDASYRHPPAWTPGGTVDSQVLAVERSSDGGATWEQVRLAHPDDSPPSGATVDMADVAQEAGLSADVYDDEAPRGVELWYRAWTETDDGVSDTGPYVAVTVEPVGEWIKVPSDPSLDLAVCLEGPLESDSDELMGWAAPAGVSEWVPATGDIRGEVFSLSLSFGTDADWEAFEAVRGLRLPVLLQTLYGTGEREQYWVRLGPTRTVTRLGTDGTGNQWRLVKVGARETRPLAAE